MGQLFLSISLFLSVNIVTKLIGREQNQLSKIYNEALKRKAIQIYPGSILFEIFWLATIANQIQNWLAISDIV